MFQSKDLGMVDFVEKYFYINILVLIKKRIVICNIIQLTICNRKEISANKIKKSPYNQLDSKI